MNLANRLREKVQLQAGGYGAAELAAAYSEHGLTQDAFDRTFTRLARLSDRTDRGTLAPDLRPVA